MQMSLVAKNYTHHSMPALKALLLERRCCEEVTGCERPAGHWREERKAVICCWLALDTSDLAVAEICMCPDALHSLIELFIHPKLD